ncbi:MAG: dienelactone hydrolase family protein [Armatimonadota bacterium]
MMSTFLATHLLAQGKAFDYKIGDQTFEGYAVTRSKSKPTVVVVQDWNGVNDHEIEVVERLGKLGYSAVAIDVYGKGVRPSSVQTCSAESGKYYADPGLFLSRLEGGIKAANIKGKFVAIGYCFGGTGVLELARHNVKNLAGVVSFHGGVKPLSASPAKINARVMVLHGAIDPFIEAADVEAVKAEMKKAKSFKFVAYPGAVHAFTVKSMGFEVDGAKYNRAADAASWKELTGALKTW